MHRVLPIDLTSNTARPARLVRYSDDELFGFVSSVKKVGGNVPDQRTGVRTATGLILEGSHTQLVRLAKPLKVNTNR